MWGAISWGAMFLIFQTLAFYAGYILSALTVNRLVPLLGNTWADRPRMGSAYGAGWPACGDAGLQVTALKSARNDNSSKLHRSYVDILK